MKRAKTASEANASAATQAVSAGPGIWRTRAVGQRYVAQVLLARFRDLEEDRLDQRHNWRQVALHGAIAYHLGLALEMAAKGAIAARSEEVPPALHDLAKLCEEAGEALEAAEKELAGRLAAAVAWWGRYPAPKPKPKGKGKGKPGAALDSRRLDLARDLRLLDALLARLGADENEAT